MVKASWRAGRDALLIVDVINDLDFAHGGQVLHWAERMVQPLRSISARARKASIPVIYANDHFGHWRSEWQAVVRHCTRPGARGRDVSRRLTPRKGDYVLLKPRHSAFFETPLRSLLTELGVTRLTLAGMATNLCVLLTAYDAYMHGYPITVLSDCCAAETDFDHNVAMSQLHKFFKATICRADEVTITTG
jgi:nicotinamidase-related amidase